ncbi:hypothetical protein BU25DRAFT_422384 [Macroventuria anomochaeta]|uniref:Uncharacterized protein n=1 Tax=Macroventuria anomochaeta TaxID=301207 RepID=A0ACB6RYY5_9PLEO|nr:uncharacterized protein BU25DRAFT_422384 [Macroventuria anomochaeta]KAF2626635.1 hypothetical protein BU25DRAFT_422384 [Macroventuria anomochaeta]
MRSEAVESSLLLGHGASFTVTRQAVSPGPNTMIDRFDFTKLITLKMPFLPTKRRQYVVYKSPRIEFQADGRTLADVQLNESPLPNELKSQISLGIANGPQTLHDEGIIHRDLKPENTILCSEEDRILVPKLADFGFAIVKEALISPNIMLGRTRTWSASEPYSCLGASGLASTDVYSFGLVVWSFGLSGLMAGTLSAC